MRRLLERLRDTIGQYWAGAVILLGIISLVALPLWYKLGSLVGGMSSSELALRLQVNADAIGIMSLLHDPFFLPYKLGLYILQFIPLYDAGSLRSISAFLGVIGIIGFYLIVREWYTRRLAILSTVLFASSSWLLHIARHGGIDSVYIFLFIVLATWIWVKRGSSKRLAFMIALPATILALYVPGFIWFLLPALFWQRRTIAKVLRRIPLKLLIPTLVVGLLLLIPLVVSLVAPSAQSSIAGNIKEFFGLPTVFPTIKEFAKNLINIPLQIFVISPPNSLLSVGRLPLLDIFTSAMVIIGFCTLIANYKLDRSKIIMAILVIGSVLIALNGHVHISLLLPFMYLLAAEGIGFLLNQWMTIFPRNPFARGLGVVVISVAIGVACAFQLTSFFVAWPHTEIVKSAFTLHP